MFFLFMIKYSVREITIRTTIILLSGPLGSWSQGGVGPLCTFREGRVSGLQTKRVQKNINRRTSPWITGIIKDNNTNNNKSDNSDTKSTTLAVPPMFLCGVPTVYGVFIIWDQYYMDDSTMYSHLGSQGDGAAI